MVIAEPMGLKSHAWASLLRMLHRLPVLYDGPFPVARLEAFEKICSVCARYRDFDDLPPVGGYPRVEEGENSASGKQGDGVVAKEELEVVGWEDGKECRVTVLEVVG